MEADLQLIREYLANTDIANTRSDLELKSARRLLQLEVEESPENAGAKLSLAITLMRLGEAAEAQQLLETLINDGGSAKLLARAARSELLAQPGSDQAIKRDLAAVKAFKLPESLHLQARSLCKTG